MGRYLRPVAGEIDRAAEYVQNTPINMTSVQLTKPHVHIFRMLAHQWIWGSVSEIQEFLRERGANPGDYLQFLETARSIFHRTSRIRIMD